MNHNAIFLITSVGAILLSVASLVHPNAEAWSADMDFYFEVQLVWLMLCWKDRSILAQTARCLRKSFLHIEFYILAYAVFFVGDNREF